jgi:hypothetical protein
MLVASATSLMDHQAGGNYISEKSSMSLMDSPPAPQIEGPEVVKLPIESRPRQEEAPADAADVDEEGAEVGSLRVGKSQGLSGSSGQTGS